MDNAFFAFVETYWDDIAAFVNAFKDFIASLISKFSGDESAEA